MIELRTLGETDLHVAGQPALHLLGQPKRLAVLIYLLVADVRVHRRDTLLAMFWPDLDEARARAALRKVLHFIRREVGDDVLINRGDESLVVDRTGIRCDATALHVAFASGDHEAVLRLHRGDFLPGFHLENAPEFDRWVEAERLRLSDAAMRAAVNYAQELERWGQMETASHAMATAQRLSPFSTTIVEQRAALMTRAGERIRAIRIYDELAHRLLEELGDHDAAIATYEEALRMREELEAQMRDERTELMGRLLTLRKVRQPA